MNRRTAADLQARVDEAVELFTRAVHKGPEIGPGPTRPHPNGPHGEHHEPRSDDEELWARFDDEDLFARAFEDEQGELLARFYDDSDVFARYDDGDLFARFDDGELELLARYDDDDALFARFYSDLDVDELD